MTDTQLFAVVQCNGCTVCCQGDAIFLHPECGDDARSYETEMYQGRHILKHKPNKDCIYLDRDTGCTIHHRKPTICRELNCAALVKNLGYTKARKMVKLGLFSAQLVREGRKRA